MAKSLYPKSDAALIAGLRRDVDMLKRRTAGGSSNPLSVLFDTYPQVDEYLFIHTTGGAPEPFSWGIHLKDDGDGGGIKIESGWNLEIDASRQVTFDVGQFYATSSGSITLNSVSGGIDVTSFTDQTYETPDGDITIRSDTGSVIASGGAGELILNNTSAELFIAGSGSTVISVGAMALDTRGAYSAIGVRRASAGVFCEFNCYASDDFSGIPAGGAARVLISDTDSEFGISLADGSGTVILRVTSDGTYHIKTGATWLADL